jgi:hypothetical protein
MPIAAIIHKQTWQFTLNPISVNHLAHSKKEKKGIVRVTSPKIACSNPALGTINFSFRLEMVRIYLLDFMTSVEY